MLKYYERTRSEVIWMKHRFLFLLILMLLVSGCRSSQPTETEFFAMDTVMQLRLYDAEDAAALSRSVIETINTLEQSFSVTLEGSELYQVNNAQTIEPSSDVAALLTQSLTLAERTGGCLDPTIYPIVKLWGFTTGEYRVPTEDERAQTLTKTGRSHIHWDGKTLCLDEGSALDFGAVAKGYAAEKCKKLLLENHAVGILTLGGNIQTVGSKPDDSPWSIGITNPNSPDENIALLRLNGSYAVVTSGGYQRYFEKDGVHYSHIMNPETGAPVQNEMQSVTIVADSGFLADGLSTALYVMGEEQSFQFWRESDDFEFVIISDRGIFVSEGLVQCFACASDYEVIHK